MVRVPTTTLTMNRISKFTLLPNAIFFGTENIGTNQIAELFGLGKNHRELTIIKSKRVSKANDYMSKQYARLEKAAREGDKAKYESISNTLLRNSRIFRLIALNRTYSGWFWEMKTSQMKRILKKLHKLCKERSSDLEYTRLWIPKGKDPYGRPLGVPTIPWRC